jgi:hypothetical protein
LLIARRTGRRRTSGADQPRQRGRPHCPPSRLCAWAGRVSTAERRAAPSPTGGARTLPLGTARRLDSALWSVLGTRFPLPSRFSVAGLADCRASLVCWALYPYVRPATAADIAQNVHSHQRPLMWLLRQHTDTAPSRFLYGPASVRTGESYQWKRPKFSLCPQLRCGQPADHK